MGNLVEIQQQIEKLQKQAQDIKTREFDKTVEEIRAKMAAFGITINDLKPGKAGKRGSAKRAASAKAAPRKAKAGRSSRAGAAVPPKYRGPNGETWSGRGLAPRWLSALIAQGQPKESFLIPS